MAVLLQVAVPPIRTLRVTTVQLASISDEATPALLLGLAFRLSCAIALVRQSETVLKRPNQWLAVADTTSTAASSKAILLATSSEELPPPGRRVMI